MGRKPDSGRSIGTADLPCQYRNVRPFTLHAMNTMPGTHKINASAPVNVTVQLSRYSLSLCSSMYGAVLSGQGHRLLAPAGPRRSTQTRTRRVAVAHSPTRKPRSEGCYYRSYIYI